MFLKALGRLDEALDAYNEIVAEHSYSVVARSGRAETLSVFVQGPPKSTPKTMAAGDIALVLKFAAAPSILQLVVTGTELASHPRTLPIVALGIEITPAPCTF